jgi:hypothetical protein
VSAVLVHSQFQLTRLTSLRLQIYRGLGIEPILDEDGNLDRVLVSECCSLDAVPVQFTDPCVA